MKKTIYLGTRMHIPASLVDGEEIAELYTHLQFDLRKCARCPYEDIRPSKYCSRCEGYKGSTELWSKRQTDEGMYYSVPLAQWRKAIKVLDLHDVKVVDTRPKILFPQDLYWTGKLRDGSEAGHANQIKVVDDFWNNILSKKKESGIIIAKTRTGKTYLSTNIVCELAHRTIIMASELAWLEQFVDAFIECTNVKKLKNAVVLVSSKKSSKAYIDVPGVLVVNSPEKIPPEACVVLFAYQGFIRDVNKVIRLLHGQYTTLVVDELHLSGAFEYSKLINNLDVTYRIGLTATLDRNDGQTPIIRRLMGDIGAESTTAAMIPELRLLETNISVTGRTPTTRVTQLAKNEKRNQMILRQVFADLNEDDDECIFIPVDRIFHMQRLVYLINQQANYENAVARQNGKREPWTTPLAMSYSGMTEDHKKVRDLAINKKIRVVVAVTKKVKYGISVPAWSTVYVGLAPIADGPAYYQLTQRVCTPPKSGDYKPPPRIRHFIDGTSDSANTLRNLWTSPFHSLKSMIEDGTIAVSTETRERLLYIVSHCHMYSGTVAKKEKANKTGGFLGIRK